MPSNHREQACARFVLELIRCLDHPGHDVHRVTRAAMDVDVTSALFIEDYVCSLLNGDEQVWADLLSRVAHPRCRFLWRYPRQGFYIDLAKGEKVDLLGALKALSPFAGQALLFFPMAAGLAEICEEALHERQWYSDFDEFMFVIEDVSPSVQKIRPVWIRPKPGSPGADVRTQPIITV